jgi:aromatic ring-opening dioxygenase catalytic subunit (LigB family)
MATPDQAPTPAAPSSRMPAIFLPHGGGPWPFMDLDQMGMAGSYVQLEQYLRQLGMGLPSSPRAILMVSAHWEMPAPTVMGAPSPPMLYDYSGFPPETYEVQWPAPGSPEVAERTRELLEGAGITSATDLHRGFDHGTFVPMMLAWPNADVPTFQLSLKRGLNPREHLAIGRALQPLRDEGVLLLGSGMSYHNMRGFFGGVPTVADDSRRFDDWLVETAAADADARDTRLAEWERAPAARACHPREEHLLPLMVIAGAAGDDPGSVPYRDRIMNAHVSATHFG